MGRSRRGGPSAVTPVTASHVAAGRVPAVTASARRPGPLPLAMSLTDRSLRDRRAIALLGTARLVRSSLPRFGGRVVPTRPRRDPEIASLIQKSSGPRGHTFAVVPRRHRRQARDLAAARRLGNEVSDRLHCASPPRARRHGSQRRARCVTSAVVGLKANGRPRIGPSVLTRNECQ